MIVAITSSVDIHGLGGYLKKSERDKLRELAMRQAGNFDTFIGGNPKQIFELLDYVDALETRNARLEEALKWYADLEITWAQSEPPYFTKLNLADKARQVLKGNKHEKE